MRHRKSRIRLTQKPAHARMLLRNLLTSLLLYESVRTTKKRAQVLQPAVDRLIRVAKTREPHLAVRSINRQVTDKNASRKIMEVFKERYSDHNSGFTRIKPLGSRKGDGAKLVEISFVEGKDVAPPPPKPKKTTSKKKAAPSPASESAKQVHEEKKEEKVEVEKRGMDEAKTADKKKQPKAAKKKSLFEGFKKLKKPSMKKKS